MDWGRSGSRRRDALSSPSPRNRIRTAAVRTRYTEFTARKSARNGRPVRYLMSACLLSRRLPRSSIRHHQAPRGGAGPAAAHRRPRSELLLRREARAREHHDRHPAECGDGLHRAVGLRQEHVPAHAEPDERHHRRHARRGQVLIDGSDIYGPATDVVALRRRVGMVFQKSNPFPKSIFENVAYGLRINGLARGRAALQAQVEESLKAAAIWDEVKDRLHESALALSGGQQQRLCIARALAIQPEILLMDEPASALDPIATQRIEELVYQLKSRYTIVIVTHNMQQAARVSDRTAFFWLGKLVEYAPTERIFTNPAEKLTEDYVTGRFG